MMEKLRQLFRLLVTYFYVPMVLVFILSMGACGAIMYNVDSLGEWCIFLTLPFVAVQPIILVAALWQRRWGIAAMALLALIVSVVIELFCIIGIAVGQHHPPIRDDYAYEDTLVVVEDSL